MLEGTVHWLLNRFLGAYVKDFNADSIRLRLFDGALPSSGFVIEPCRLLVITNNNNASDEQAM